MIRFVILHTLARTALRSEANALSYIGPFLHENFPTQISRPLRSGKKRKRSAGTSAGAQASSHPLFESTPLESLTTQGMNEDQIWEQLELRGLKLHKLIKGIVSVEGGEVEADESDEDEEEQKPAGRPFKKNATLAESNDDDEEEGEEEEADRNGMKIVHSLDELSDAELRALGVDPSMREQLQDYTSDDDDASSSADTSISGEGYAGASDLSDIEESRDISYEPLLDEREQQRRKEALIQAEYARTRAQKRALKSAGMHVEDDSSEEEEEEDTTDEDDENIDPELRAMLLANRRAAEEEEEEDSDEEPDDVSTEERRKAGILDNLDEPGSGVSTGQAR